MASTTTPWQRGVRLVDDEGRPYSAADIEIGSMYTALPEHADPEQLGSGLIVVRLPPDELHLPPARRDWAPDGIIAYSKICPHAACAISLYRYPTYTADERRAGVHLPVPLLDLLRPARAEGCSSDPPAGRCRSFR